MKLIFGIVFSILTFQVNFAQNSIRDTATRVLLIPFDRFEMHSDFTLEEINRINKLEKDQFYQELLQIFTASFETYNGNGIQYALISNEDWKKFKMLSSYKYRQKEAHYSCDLYAYAIDEYQELLDEYNCTYLLVIPWYKILESKEKVKTEEVRRVGFYSEHLIDYDIFDREKELIFFEASKKFRAHPTLESLSTKGLLLKDLISTYGVLTNEISIEFVQRLKK